MGEFDELLFLLRGKGYDIPSIRLEGDRFKVDASDNKKSGSYKVSQTSLGYEILVTNFKESEIPQRFRAGEVEQLSEAEKETFEKETKENAEKEAHQLSLRREIIRLEAEARWARTKEDPHFQMLIDRGLHGSYGTHRDGSLLLVPCRDLDGTLWSLQVISKDKKMFQKYAKAKGLMHFIGEIDPIGRLYICESFFTSASFHEFSRGEPVVCAFSSHSFKKVAQELRAKYPRLKLVFSGDRDAVGIRASKEAAKLVNGDVLIPDFKNLNGHSDFNDWNDFTKSIFEGGRQMAVEQISDYQNKSKRSLAFKQQWIDDYLTEHKVEFLYSGLVKVDGKPIKREILSINMFLEADRENVNLSERLIEALITKKQELCRIETLETIKKILTPFDPASIEIVKEFVFYLTGLIEEETVSVLLHFLWQVKRKAFGLPVKFHMMPVFEGKSGSGKSEAIQKLLGPISPMHQIEGMEALSDERKWEVFEKYLVINMDEMQNAAKADIEGIKRTITAPVLNQRIMRSNSHNVLQNNSTFIGSTNKTLSILIKDPESIRRFYAIETLSVAELEQNWDKLNSIDYVNLWKAVDLNGPCPLLASRQAIVERQEEMRFKDPTEEWVDEIQLLNSENNRIPNSQLYANFKIWAEDAGWNHLPVRSVFSKRLCQLGFKSYKSGSIRGFEVTAIDFNQ